MFRHYRGLGAVGYREFVVRSLRAFLDGALTLTANFPSTARVTLTRQADKNRFVLHLLYAPTISRGGQLKLSGGNVSRGAVIEVIEDLPPLRDVRVSLQLSNKIARVSCVPGGRELAFETVNGKTEIAVPQFHCHQMIELGLADS